MQRLALVMTIALLIPAWPAPSFAQTNSDGAEPQPEKQVLVRVIDPLDSISLVHFKRRKDFIDKLLFGGPNDSTASSLLFERNAFSKTESLLTVPDSVYVYKHADFDWVDDYLLPLYAHTTPTLDLGAFVRAGLTPSPESLAQPQMIAPATLPLPSPFEIRALGLLWTSSKATGPQMYAKLDSSARVTAESFMALLRSMAQRGYLSEKLVSPQNLFTLVTPLFAIPIEMSAKNRKNRVYEYQPRISERELLDLLMAKRYLLTLDSTVADSTQSKQIDALLTTLVKIKFPAAAASKPN